MKFSSRVVLAVLSTAFCGAVATQFTFVSAQPSSPSEIEIETFTPLGSLRSVPTPLPSNLSTFVRSQRAAIALGKALFWDMQAGSDGIQACASCHFNAGADSRSKNEIDPGINGGDTIFSSLPGGGGGPNSQLHISDFPLHHLADPGDRSSAVLFDTNDVVGSQGVFASVFGSVVPARSWDNTTPESDAAFNVGGINTRRVTPRNTPSVINAIFNYRSFWDGRAQNECNGVNPFGERDPASHVYTASSVKAVPAALHVKMTNASLCSQSLGPPMSGFEMSADGRTWKNEGRKLVTATPLNGGGNPVTPLGRQVVLASDSILGGFAKSPGKGLNVNYLSLIQTAFNPQFWQSSKLFCVDSTGADRGIVDTQAACDSLAGGANQAIAYQQVEYNFSLFWSVSIMLYESTLRADYTPLDQYFEQAAASKLPAPITLTSNDGVNLNGTLPSAPVRRMSVQVKDSSGTVIAKDNGEGQFTGALVSYGTMNYSTGALSLIFAAPIPAPAKFTLVYAKRPTALTDQQELGLAVFEGRGKCANCHGGPELTNASVANVKNATLERMQMANGSVAVYDSGFYNTSVRPSSEDVGIAGQDPFGNPLSVSALCQQNGTLCTALGLSDPPAVAPRPGDNVSTAPLSPYEPIAVKGAFKAPALRDVALTAPYFHNGGTLSLDQVVDFYNRGGDFADQNIDNLDPDIEPLNLTPDEKAALVAFLNALTDDNVRFQRAPFDHPQLFVPYGHPGDSTSVTADALGKNATDQLLEIPAVGSKGSSSPLPTFLQTLAGP